MISINCEENSVNFTLYPASAGIRIFPRAKRFGVASTEAMIRPGFLDPESRRDLIELARDGSAAHRLARRANALVLLDEGMNCAAVAKVLLLDDDTIRSWHSCMRKRGSRGWRASARRAARAA